MARRELHKRGCRHKGREREARRAAAEAAAEAAEGHHGRLGPGRARPGRGGRGEGPRAGRPVENAEFPTTSSLSTYTVADERFASARPRIYSRCTIHKGGVGQVVEVKPRKQLHS